MATVFCKYVYVQLSKIIGCPETLMRCKMHETLQGLFGIVVVVQACFSALRIHTA